MTDIEKLSDRELDALVAEKVMGWKMYKGAWFPEGFDFEVEKHKYNADWLSNGIHIPHYSADIAAAWQVVEKMKADFSDGSVEGFSLWFSSNPVQMPHWKCMFENSEDHVKAEAPTAPRAICLAALRACDKG